MLEIPGFSNTQGDFGHKRVPTNIIKTRLITLLLPEDFEMYYVSKTLPKVYCYGNHRILAEHVLQDCTEHCEVKKIY